MTLSAHLQPTAPLTERVLVPGDPGRALLIAQALLETPRMFNHHRGLWGYTGIAPDGEPLTVQSTGMGGPSAAIVIAELADLGARWLLRVGTCGALQSGLSLGDLVIGTGSTAADGTSRALGVARELLPSEALVTALLAERDSRIHPGPVVSTDLFPATPGDQERQWRSAGCLAVDMETAALLAMAADRGLQAASLLIVSELLFPSRTSIDPDALREAEHRAGKVAIRALMAATGGRRARL